MLLDSSARCNWRILSYSVLHFFTLICIPISRNGQNIPSYCEENCFIVMLLSESDLLKTGDDNDAMFVYFFEPIDKINHRFDFSNFSKRHLLSCVLTKESVGFMVTKKKVRMMYYSVMTQANSEKEIPSSPNKSRTYDLPITSSNDRFFRCKRWEGSCNFCGTNSRYLRDLLQLD